ncbi:MAG: glycosyltransferase, partial [Ferruginibacter sp.]
HTTIPCVYITHQLTIKTTNRFTEWLAKKIHYFFINKFLFCWVPDNESSNNLAGALSHPYQLPLIPIIYIGPLSRFVKFSVEKKYDCIALVSGPEPQRTIFENILLRELNLFEGKSLLIRGLPEKDEKVTIVNKRVEIINHLTATALNKAMLQADLIVCRSGYTSVIDLVQLQKKAVLVATPGQTEQEYLAAYLQQQHFFPSISQNRFTLNKAFDMINDFTFVNIDINTEVYKTVLHKFVSFIKQDQ